MDGIDYNQAWFYAAIYAVGFAAAIFRLASTRDLNGFSYCLGVAGVSGFVAFATVTVVGLDGYLRNPWGPIGVAAIVGIGGKEISQPLIAIVVGIIKAVARRSGLYNDDQT